MYDYVKYSPGPIVSDFKELMSQFRSVVDNKDIFRKQRRSLANLIHKNKDHFSTERVVALIEKIMKE